MDINKVTIIGRLTDKPQAKEQSSGQTLARFSIATNYIWKDVRTKEKKENTEFHDVTVWGKLAEIVLTYLEKGSRVYIEGRLQYRKWQDADAKTRKSTDIIADEIIMLGHNGRPKSEKAFAKTEPSDKELLVEFEDEE